jgi:hypothetical protein
MPDVVEVKPIASETQSIKPAWKTSEGWLNFLTGVLGAATAAHFIGDGSQVATVAGLAITFASALIHTLSRTTLKKAVLS